MAAVLKDLDKVDAPAAARARYRYGCFEDYGEEPQAYGYAATFDLTRSCEDAVVAQLIELRRRRLSRRSAEREGGLHGWVDSGGPGAKCRSVLNPQHGLH
jgi:erythromycin esterase-like protein